MKKIPIKQTKLVGIEYLLPYTPEEFKEFYDDLITWSTVDVCGREDEHDIDRV